MQPAPIPVRLTLSESTAAALATAADDLSAANDTEHFLAALEGNHRLWQVLTTIAQRNDWIEPNRHLADFVVAASRTAGKGLRDEHLETLVEINRDLSTRLARGRELARIRQRATLAWKERGRPLGFSFERWLINEMERLAQTPTATAAFH